MRMQDDQDEKMSTPVVYMVAGVSAVVLIILAGVLLSNTQRRNIRNSYLAAATEAPSEMPESVAESMEFAEGQGDIETLYREHRLRAEDLDFWDMYDHTEVIIETPSPTPSIKPEPTEEEMATDGKHIQISYRDGTSQWLKINDEIPFHEYDFTRLKAQNGKMAYYEQNKRVSRLGIELSEESGIVNFETLKAEGIDYVMIKVGERGYESGRLVLDEKFFTYIQGARQADIDVGVYFCSQAVTASEAVDEAAFVMDNIKTFTVTYPIVFRMDMITNDTARTDILDAKQKTEIAGAFIDAVEREGYFSAVYGDKEFLLTQVIPEEILPKYDVWLTDFSPVPDYPYQFKLWEYAGNETLQGVEKKVNYTISFVDYSRR